MIKSIKTEYLLVIIIALAWATFHYPLLITDPLLIRDDRMLIAAVKSVSSLSDYFFKLSLGEFLDIQPVRDLTFWLNIKLHDLTLYGGFHLFNLILGAGILCVLNQILKDLGIDETKRFLSILLISFHPILNSNMAWTSNRKHLLAIFFILQYLRDWLLAQKFSVKGLLFYILSVFSQPITIFIPLVCIACQRLKEKKISLNVIEVLTIIVFLIFVGMNFYFYQNKLNLTNLNQHPTDILTFSSCLSHFGRVMMQITLPVSLGIEYDENSFFNLIGLILAIVFCLVIFQRKTRHILFLSFLGMLLSTLYPVLRWHARDGYLLFSLLVMIPILVVWISESKMFSVIISLFLLFFFVQSFRYTRAWGDDLSLTKFSYESEGGFQNTIKYATVLSISDPTAAYKIFSSLRLDYPEVFNYMLAPMLAQTYYQSAHVSNEEKLKEYLETKSNERYFLFYKAKFLMEHDYQEQGRVELKSLQEVLKSNPSLVPEFRAFVCERYQKNCLEWGL